MSSIYAMGDIHGELEAFETALSYIDLDTYGNELILLGDYINRGTNSCAVLYRVMELTTSKRCEAILGNHEVQFLEWLYGADEIAWLTQDEGFLTTRTFLTEEQFETVILAAQAALEEGKDFYTTLNAQVLALVKENHPELLAWLQELPLYIERPGQIYVHAGVDELAGESWKQAIDKNIFTDKYPATIGPFYCDVIAGHISTVEISQDEECFGYPFWDGTSHFYLDGDTLQSGIVPVLKYDKGKKSYTSFRVDGTDATGNDVWIEYMIKG